MRALLRLVVAALAASAMLVLPSSPAHADPASPQMSVNLCDTLNLNPCPAGLAKLELQTTREVVLANGCTHDFASIPPSSFWYYDPELGASYPILYEGVAVDEYCPAPTNLTAEAVSQPTATARTGSKTYDKHVCLSSTYCEATAVWGHNELFGEPVCAYTTATGTIGATPLVPYFPGWSIAGANCF